MEYLLALLPAAALLMALLRSLHKRRLGKQREFARRLDASLFKDSEEELEAVYEQFIELLFADEEE